MPLIGKQEFVRKKPPTDIKPGEELFYCKHTKEVFRKYEDLFQRVILCNSMVWSCGLSGRIGLTFQEALKSEESTRAILRSFPNCLKRPIMQLISMSKKTFLTELVDDIYNFTKERYFVGEDVEAVINGEKKPFRISMVIPAVKKSKKKESLGDVVKLPVYSGDAAKFKYQLVELTGSRRFIVSADAVSRPRGSYTKEKNRLFIRQCVEVTDEKILILKQSLVEKYHLKDFFYKRMFAGPYPPFASPVTKTKNKKDLSTPVKSGSPSKKKSPSTTNDEKGSPKGGKVKKKDGKSSPKNGKLKKAEEKNLPKDSKGKRKGETIEELRKKMEEQRKKRQEEKDKKMEEQKKKRQEEKDKEKERKRKERQLLAAFLAHWRKPREDLECDDLQELPIPTSIDCTIPSELFGDAVMVLEFLHHFGNLIDLRSCFSQEITLDLFLKMMHDTDIVSSYADIVNLLLLALLKQQDELDIDKNGFSDELLNETHSIQEATAWSLSTKKNHGIILRRMPLDPFTLTELVRLHLLSSGAARKSQDYRADPGLTLKEKDPHILETLAFLSVYELPAGDRIKLMKVLIDQLLAYPAFRDAIDENAEKLRRLRSDLKQLQWAESRRETLARMKKKEKEKGNSVSATTENKDVIHTDVKEESDEDEKLHKDFLHKERDYCNQITKLSEYGGVVSLGLDRAYRRYWVFGSIPGLFVEHDDSFVGSCLPKATPSIPAFAGVPTVNDIPLSFVKKFEMQRLAERTSGNDKENSTKQGSHLQPKHPNGAVKMSRLLGDWNSNGALPWNVLKLGGKADCTFVCTASPKSCPVHCPQNPQFPRWGFFYQEEDVDRLLGALNARGLRELALREQLSSGCKNLKEWVSKCPKHYLSNAFPKEEQTEVRRSDRLHKSKAQFIGMAPREALEVTLRDAILDSEEKLWKGSLGAIRVRNRDEWRQAILDNSYDIQCEKLKWGEDKTLENTQMKGEQKQEQVVRDLSCAVLQLAQAVDRKCLQPPLGESEEYSKFQTQVNKFQQESSSGEDSDNEEKRKARNCRRSQMELWEESLMCSTSLSQLFLHLATLERSILWGRSVTAVCCRICRRRGDGENMLLCDGCDRGQHIYCLQPPLHEIPEGNWYCSTCQPAKPRARPQYKDESMENSSEENGLDSDEDDKDEDADKDYKENNDICKACKRGGTLICCDGCPMSFHLECITPPLRRVPRGTWLCSKCTRKPTQKRHSQRLSVSRTTQNVTNNSLKRSSSEFDTESMLELLNLLMKHPQSWPFVPTNKHKQVNHHKARRTINLPSIRLRLARKGYSSGNELVADLNLMFQNCETYSGDGDEQVAGERLGRYFRSLQRRFKLEETVDGVEADLLPAKRSRLLAQPTQ